MPTLLRILLVALLVPAALAVAQENPPAAAAPPENPFTANSRMMYRGVTSLVLGSAEKMPEEHFGFKPAEGIRTFGQIVGHAADAQYAFCSVVRGEKNPAPKIEKTKTTKADLIAALRDAVAYCEKAYDGMNDASATEMVKLMGRDMPKVGALYANSLHTVEHYGNLVTYLRMKNIVPPTSDPEFMKTMMK